MKKTGKEETKKEIITKEDEVSVKIVTSDKCNFRKVPLMREAAIVGKAPAGQCFNVKKIVTEFTVRYYLLDNGYYISSLEPHSLFNE